MTEQETIQEQISLWASEGIDPQEANRQVQRDLMKVRSNLGALVTDLETIRRWQCQRDLSLEDMARIKDASDDLAQSAWALALVVGGVALDIGPEC